MLLGIFILVSSLIFGFSLVSRLEFADTILLRLSIGIPIGIASFATLSLLFYYLNGTVTALLLFLTALLLLALSAFLVLQANEKRISARSLKKYAFGKGFGLPKRLAIFLLVMYIVIELLFAASAFYSHGVFYCEGPGCSDTIFHISIGNSLLHSGFPPKLYIAYGAVNVFPFMYDFFDSIMLEYGFGLNGALMVPEALLVFSFVSLSVLAAYRITGSRLKAAFSSLILWFGGVGFIQLLDYPFRNALSGIMQPIHLLGTAPMGHGAAAALNSAVYVATDFVTFWTSIINTMLIAQRDFILGLPLGFAIIYMLYIFAFERRKPSKKEAAFLGLCFGILPLIHPLTLITVTTVGAFALVLYVVTSRKRMQALYRCAIAVGVALAVALPELLFINSQSRGERWFYYIYQGYVIQTHNLLSTIALSTGNVIFFWVEVAGIPAVLAFVGLLYATKRERLLFIPFLALWALITVISIVPNPADSNEIFLYVFFILAVLSSEFLYKLWKSGHRYAGKAVAVALIVLICFNILFVMYHDDLHNVQLIADNQELRSAAFIVNNTPANAIFAVSNYNTFGPVVPSLAYRQTIISISQYVGGIVTVPQQSLIQINSMIIGTGNCTAIREYDVSYIYLLGSAPSRAPFENSNFQVVYNEYDPSLGNITIYRSYCGG